MKMSKIEKQLVNSPSHSQQVSNHADALLQLVDFEAGQTYLDMGCGNGAAPIHIAKKYRLKATGIDVDPDQIRQAETLSQGLNNVRFLTIDGVHYDYRPGSPERLWLEGVVTDARARHLWVVIVQHKPCLSSAEKSCDPGEELTDWQAANVAAAAHLILGIERSDVTLIERGLRDRVHQPRREHLYPRSMALVAEAARLGAIGATISGAGPTVLVWSHGQSADEVEGALRSHLGDWAVVRRAPFSSHGADAAEL